MTFSLLDWFDDHDGAAESTRHVQWPIELIGGSIHADEPEPPPGLARDDWTFSNLVRARRARDSANPLAPRLSRLGGDMPGESPAMRSAPSPFERVIEELRNPRLAFTRERPGDRGRPVPEGPPAGGTARVLRKCRAAALQAR